jgi:hypothetical protein
LAHSLKKGQGFDVTDRAANLNNSHFNFIRRAQACAAFDEVLNFVGDVRNDLNGDA